MALFIGIASFVIFLFFQALGIFTGDSGDVVTAAVVHGVPHPPGYPLYTFLGYLFSLVPVYTPSWRVTLLSSLPHAVTIALVFVIVYRLTKSRVAGVFACLVLLGNYLFFLYSVTPEVFALFDLFFVLLLLECIQYNAVRSLGMLSFMALTFGLALTHHHVILFMLPVLMYYVVRVGFPKKFGVREVGTIVIFFIFGLLPYIYAPIAGSTNAIINWDTPTTWARFIHLVTRADYGSFVSGGVIGHTLFERFVAIKAYVSFVSLDFKSVGIVLSVIGLWRLWQRDRVFAKAVGLLLFIFGPFFFFYASFPIVGRFTLGTYERFLLPSYCLYAILIGIGYDYLTRSKKTLIVSFFSIVLFLYPVTMASVTLYRFTGLRIDQTAEQLGRDVLESVPKDAILLLSQDTLLFTTQYVRYGMNVRPDTIVLHASRMSVKDYQDVVKKRFPTIIVPETTPHVSLGEFVKANISTHRIFSNNTVSLGSGWVFVPHGLLYEIVSADNLTPFEELKNTNTTLFHSYANPLSGILSRYKHLMLSDVLDVYAWAHINYGKTLVRATDYRAAIHEFQLAIALDGDSSKADAFTYLGATYAVTGRCSEALTALGSAKDASHAVKPEQILYESLTYRDCIKDATKAATLFSEYEILQSKSETLLQSL